MGDLKAPFDPLINTLFHPGFTTPISPIGLLLLKLPPAPCEVLLVTIFILIFNYYTLNKYIYIIYNIFLIIKINLYIIFFKVRPWHMSRLCFLLVLGWWLSWPPVTPFFIEGSSRFVCGKPLCCASAGL